MKEPIVASMIVPLGYDFICFPCEGNCAIADFPTEAGILSQGIPIVEARKLPSRFSPRLFYGTCEKCGRSYIVIGEYDR